MNLMSPRNSFHCSHRLSELITIPFQLWLIFLAIERTTLTRNLALLEKKGLVKLIAAGKGNARTVQLTPAGRQLMTDMTPAWRDAQNMAFKQVTRDEVDQALDVLRRITAELSRGEKA